MFDLLASYALQVVIDDNNIVLHNIIHLRTLYLCIESTLRLILNFRSAQEKTPGKKNNFTHFY